MATEHLWLTDFCGSPLASSILTFLGVRGVGSVFATSRIMMGCQEDAVLWYDFSQAAWEPRVALPTLPPGPPGTSSPGRRLAARSSDANWLTWRERLRRWHAREACWHILLPRGDALPRMFLHRAAVVPDANCAIIFGGRYK